MEIEKTLQVQAPREKVWELLLDPHVMTGAVPGMQSIDVVSPTEYVAQMKVKISFISAKFKLHTNIVEQRAPEYLRVEGTGEDTSVASSLKQSTEVFLAPTPDGGTELRIKATVDVLGRLGTFGLSVMKTKADRLWEEFGENLVARIDGPEPTSDTPTGSPDTTVQAATPAASPAGSTPGAKQDTPLSEPAQAAATAPVPGSTGLRSTSVEEAKGGWFARLIGGGRTAGTSAGSSDGQSIRIEVRRIDQTITIEWPVSEAAQCKEWLETYLAASDNTKNAAS